jgi:hexosaminidase
MKKIILILVIGVFHQYLFSQDTLQEKYNLMPWPQQISENNAPFKIDETVTISIAGEDFKKRVANASVQFLRRLANRTGVFINTGFPIKQEKTSIKISFDTVSNLTIESDETYSLEVKENSVLIKAKTDVGALRGLETLLQLVNFNQNGYYFE